MKKKLGEVTLRDIVFNIGCDGCNTCSLVSFCGNIENIYCTQPGDSSHGMIEAFFDTEEVECLNDDPKIIDWKKVFARQLDAECPYDNETKCEKVSPDIHICGEVDLNKCWVKWWHENK